jgi:ribose transport system ATP-binding protein
MMVSGIDLSVGPVMGMATVVGSFFLVKDAGVDSYALGWLLMMLVAIVVGFVNWFLVEGLRMHPMVATLATFMAVQAVSLILRPVPGGLVDGKIMQTLGMKIGIMPVTFIFAVVLALVLEYALYRRQIGVSMRGLGSRQEAARTAGIRPVMTRLFAYVACSFFAGMAAITMVAQVGVGDPRSGISYTLGSIAAVVIGGASLFGGRGSFIGALLGAIFIVQVNSVTVFLRLSQEWQQYLLGFLILASVALYSKSREKVVQV